jgi:glutamate-1-semialdehyde-2,1-aminomutase
LLAAVEGDLCATSHVFAHSPDFDLASTGQYEKFFMKISMTMETCDKNMHVEKESAPRPLGKSQAWLKRAKQVIPGCAQTFSKSPMVFVQNVAPNFLAKAEGACVWDVDGNRYIDYINGLGPIVLGHCHPAVDDAVRAQMSKGMSYSLPHPVEVQVAEKLCEVIPCAQMVRFGKNGSDATSGAVRVARAFTGRDKIACCGYHGWQDWYIGSTARHLGVPAAVRSLTLTFPYNNLNALAKLFGDNPSQIACVIMEPVSFETPLPGYLEGVKALCRQNGALLVFDEVVTGFRLALGGAQEYYRVSPDLACFGKGMANGYPLSAIVGQADIMRLFNEVFFSFTHGGEALSLAACLATLQEIEQKDVIAHFWRIGTRLKDATNHLTNKLGIAAQIACIGLPPWTGLHFSDAVGKGSMLLRSLFQQEALKRGLLTHGNHMLSFSHDDTIIDQTLVHYEAIFGVLAQAIKNGDVARRLEGPPMETIIRPI